MCPLHYKQYGRNLNTSNHAPFDSAMYYVSKSKYPRDIVDVDALEAICHRRLDLTCRSQFPAFLLGIFLLAIINLGMPPEKLPARLLQQEAVCIRCAHGTRLADMLFMSEKKSVN